MPLFVSRGNFKGQTTDSLKLDVSAAELRFKVMKMGTTTTPPIGSVQVTRETTTYGYKWKVTFVDSPGNQPPFTLDGGLLTCSELGYSFGVELNAEYNAGIRPVMDSSNYGSVELSGDSIAGETICEQSGPMKKGSQQHGSQPVVLRQPLALPVCLARYRSE